MPIHVPKIRVFGGFCPQNGEQYERDPQKAHPWAETRVATRPGFPGMSRICTMLSRIPARPAPGRQMSRISRCSQDVNNDNNNNSNNWRDSYNIM